MGPVTTFYWPSMNTILRFAAALVLGCCLSCCTLGYQSKWEKAAASAETKNRVGLAGAWEGRWRNGTGESTTAGHSGMLWAIATPESPADGKPAPTKYHFKYMAAWGKARIGVFGMEHETKGKDAAGRFVLGGERNLGIFGVYRFSGYATPSMMHVVYTSKMNSGVFELKRPPVK